VRTEADRDVLTRNRKCHRPGQGTTRHERRNQHFSARTHDAGSACDRLDDEHGFERARFFPDRDVEKARVGKGRRERVVVISLRREFDRAFRTRMLRE